MEVEARRGFLRAEVGEGEGEARWTLVGVEMAVGSAAEVWWMFFVKKVGEGVESEGGRAFVGAEVEEGSEARRIFLGAGVGEGVEAEAGMIFVGGEVDEGIKAEV